MFQQITANTSGKVRRETLEGRTYLVVNGVLLAEAVLDGSDGPIFYPDQENGKNPEAWNGIPLVVYHPAENGAYISARQPTVYNTRKVGYIFNTVHQDKKIKPEFWFDEERTKEVDVRIVNKLEKEEPIEVSSGLMMDVAETPGEFNGTAYKGVSVNQKPDHVAILPDKIGALSVARGGGIFANAAREPESVQEALSRTLAFALGPVKASLTANALSFDDVTRMLTEALGATYGEKGKYWRGYVCEVFPDRVVFWDKEECWAQAYTATESGVELTGEAAKVVRSVEYKPVTANQEKETEMAFDKKAHVGKLIGNGFDEKDRAGLEALPEELLQKIQPAKKEEPPAPVVNTAPVLPTPPVFATNEQALASLPPDLRATLERAVARDEAHKAGLITTIVANSKFAADFLKAKKIEELEALADLATKAAGDPTSGGMFRSDAPSGSYYGAAGYQPVANQAKDLEAPLMEPDLFG